MDAVLFVHGLIGHMRVKAIESTFGDRALAPNLLGYGEHARYEGEISLPAQVEYLRRLLDEKAIASAHIAGHSVGGAIAMLFARQYPQRVRSVISIEGNFTLKDAFWSSTFAAATPLEAQAALQADRADPAGWLQRSGVTPTPERIAEAQSHLDNQPASTMQAMARSVVQITANPQYVDDVMTVLNNGTRVHLLAGERSREAWDVPDFVLDNAEMTVLPNTGHLLTIESPDAFARACSNLVER